MSKIIDEKTKKELQQILINLVSPVTLLFFTQKNSCPTCTQQHNVLQELAALSDKIEFQVYDFVIHRDEAASLNIDKIPATVVRGKKDYGIRFYGLTVGYEFASLIEAIMMVSTTKLRLNPELEALVRKIPDRIHIQVFVTLTCPYCPKMVHTVHQFAFINENITADMIEASEFPHLVQKYNVTGVPKTVVNETASFEGALPDAAAYMEIIKAINPEKYRQLEGEIRGIQNHRKTVRAEPNHEYEVIIVGGGPAAMSAAIYSIRKGMDVALITKKFGGQIADTASIENYLGLPAISGSEMTELFRSHMEIYPIAEVLGVDVVQVKKEANHFVAITDDDQQYKSFSIIYCAGKEYRRLGVVGEERFIGKGIGFCATCDAPLYRGKRVAVIGGGNSAFTAIRDLLTFANEIHLIHRRSEFRADEALIQEVTQAKNVTFHTSMIVNSFLGKDKLTGVRLESVDRTRSFDLNVDGVFLEIGLIPNSNPIKGLVELNEYGEIPVDRNESTEINGLFAAGDVTDVREKQIAIAVGQGALAALAAHKYLVESHLTKSKIGLKDTWQ